MNEKSMQGVTRTLLGLVLVAAFVAIWLPTYQELSRTAEEAEGALIQELPKVEESTIVARAAQLQYELARPASQDHQHYLDLLDKGSQLGLAIWRFRQEHPDERRKLDTQIDFRGLSEGFKSAQRRYSIKFPDMASVTQSL